MAGSVNKVLLLGHVGKDPEIRNLQNGDKVANFSLATSKRFKGRDGEQQERTEWHRVVVFGKLVEIIERYVKKGSKLYVEGEIQSRKWKTKEGEERTAFEINVPMFGGAIQLLDKSGGGGDEAAEDRSTGRTQDARRQHAEGPPADPDDDVGFGQGNAYGDGW